MTQLHVAGNQFQKNIYEKDDMSLVGISGRQYAAVPYIARLGTPRVCTGGYPGVAGRYKGVGRVGGGTNGVLVLGQAGYWP